MSERQDDFLRRTRLVLDEAEQGVDGATRTRLAAARREALAAAGRRRPLWLLPAGGLAVAAAVAVLSVGLWRTPPLAGSLDALEDIALLSDEADPAFYADLEFYAWIAAGAPPLEDDNG